MRVILVVMLGILLCGTGTGNAGDFGNPYMPLAGGVKQENDSVPSAYEALGNLEKREAREKGMSVNELRRWKADQIMESRRAEHQALYIGAAIILAGIAIACAITRAFPRKKKPQIFRSEYGEPVLPAAKVAPSPPAGEPRTMPAEDRLALLEERFEAEHNKYKYSS